MSGEHANLQAKHMHNVSYLCHSLNMSAFIFYIGIFYIIFKNKNTEFDGMWWVIV